MSSRFYKDKARRQATRITRAKNIFTYTREKLDEIISVTPGIPGPTGDVGPVGPAGPHGPTGASPVGPEGAVGDAGPSGPDGSAGLEGAVGDAGPDGPDGTEGPEGPEGAVGDAGPDGPDGPEGPEGPDGAVGDEGPTGPPTPGPEGPEGPEGPQGGEGLRGPTGCEGSDTSPGPYYPPSGGMIIAPCSITEYLVDGNGTVGPLCYFSTQGDTVTFGTCTWTCTVNNAGMTTTEYTTVSCATSCTVTTFTSCTMVFMAEIASFVNSCTEVEQSSCTEVAPCVTQSGTSSLCNVFTWEKTAVVPLDGSYCKMFTVEQPQVRFETTQVFNFHNEEDFEVAQGIDTKFLDTVEKESLQVVGLESSSPAILGARVNTDTGEILLSKKQFQSHFPEIPNEVSVTLSGIRKGFSRRGWETSSLEGAELAMSFWNHWQLCPIPQGG